MSGWVSTAPAHRRLWTRAVCRIRGHRMVHPIFAWAKDGTPLRVPEQICDRCYQFSGEVK